MKRTLPKWLKEAKPEYYCLDGIELTAANLLRGHLASITAAERRILMRSLVPKEVDTDALITLLREIQDGAIDEMNHQIEAGDLTDRLMHYTKKAAADLSKVDFAVLENGVTVDLVTFLSDLRKSL